LQIGRSTEARTQYASLPSSSYNQPPGDYRSPWSYSATDHAAEAAARQRKADDDAYFACSLERASSNQVLTLTLTLTLTLALTLKSGHSGH